MSLYIKGNQALTTVKTQKKQFILLSILAIFGFATFFLKPFGASAAGSLSLGSSASSVNNGSNFVVSVRVNPGVPVTGVETVTTYDQSKVQFVSIDTAGSGFSAAAYEAGGSGKVSIDRFSISPVQGDLLVAKINFKAIAGSGTASFSVSGKTDSMGDASASSSGSASVAMTTPTAPNPNPPTNPNPNPPANPNPPTTPTNPNPTPSPSQPSTPGTPSAPGGSSGGGVKPSTPTPKNTPGATELIFNDVNRQFTKASLAVNTTNAAKVVIIYGISGDSLNFQTPQTDLSTTHNINFDSNSLIPGTTYYYQVVAENSDGVRTISEVKTFKTQGYTVKLVIKDKNGKFLKKKQVTLFSEPMTAKTDDDGVVEFIDVAPGEHMIEYSLGDEKYSQRITVDNEVTEDPSGVQVAGVQNISVIYDTLTQTTLLTSKLAIAVATIVGVLAIGLLAMRSGYAQEFVGNIQAKSRRRSRGVELQSPPSSYTPQSTNNTNQTPVNNDQNGNPAVYNVGAPKQQNPGAVINPTGNDQNKGGQ